MAKKLYSDKFGCVQLISVYDGDTFTIDIPDVPSIFGEAISVRLKGVDTPEIRTRNQCEKDLAELAKQFVLERLSGENKCITLRNLERDKYFRIVAEVKVDDVDLAQMLLDKHFAVPYYGGTKQDVDWCVMGAQYHNNNEL